MNPQEVENDWLTPAEAARSLKISVNTVYSLIASDRMPGPIRIGSQWRISRRALEAAVQPWASSHD
jgi:excisionase family DNA binding protein